MTELKPSIEIDTIRESISIEILHNSRSENSQENNIIINSCDQTHLGQNPILFSLPNNHPLQKKKRIKNKNKEKILPKPYQYKLLR